MGKLYAIKNGDLFMRPMWNSRYEEYDVEWEELDIWNMSDILYARESDCIEFMEDLKNWYRENYDVVENCFSDSVRHDLSLDEINDLKVVIINLDINFEEE